MSQNVHMRRASPPADLHEVDFYSWTQQQAKLLRSGSLEALDIANICEEIETLGRSERASLKSAYRLICLHLLKMQYQADRYTRSWLNTVDRERAEAVDILDENPGLRPSRTDVFAKAYKLARKDAARETHLPLSVFPEIPSFTLEDCESPTYLPRVVHDRDEQRDDPSGAL